MEIYRQKSKICDKILLPLLPAVKSDLCQGHTTEIEREIVKTALEEGLLLAVSHQEQENAFLCR